MKKRILSILLALVMAASLLPMSTLAQSAGAGDARPLESGAAEPASVTVSFTAQAEGAFLFAPQLDVPVSGGLAETYGYTDAVEGGVSALDVLVKAHEVRYGSAFTAETAGDYLAVSDTGFITKLFGAATGSCGFTVNGSVPHNDVLADDSYAPGGKSYTGYTITQAQAEEGDLLEFFLYQDSYALDNYPLLERAGALCDRLSAKPGAEVALTVKGYCIGYYGCVPLETLENLEQVEVLEGAKLAWVDALTGELTDIAAVPESGAVTLTMPESEGGYWLTAYMPAEEIEDNYATPVILRLVPVTADENAQEPDAPQYGPCDLTALSVADFDSNPNALTLTPEFSPEVTEYTAPTVPYQSVEYLRMAYVKATAADENAVLTAACNGVTATLTSGDSYFKSLAKALRPGEDNVLTVTVENGSQTKVYAVTIPMAADPASMGTLELSGCHSAQVDSLKLYTYTNGTKGAADLLAGKTPENGQYETLSLAAGSYWVEGYDANGDCNGGVKVTVAAGTSSAYKIQRIYQISTNSGWVKDTDYTLTVTVTDADGNVRPSEAGRATNWGTVSPSCIFAVGDTVTVTVTPDAEKHPNYNPAMAAKTPTMNDSISASCKEFVAVTFHVPEDAVLTVGTLAKSYVYSYTDAFSAPTVSDGEQSVLYRLNKGTTYFYRVQHPDGVTYWNYASWSAAAEVEVTAEDLYIGSTDFNKNTVLNDFSHNIYDLGSIYLNINAQGFCSMEVGETYELNSFRSWQAIESFMNAKIAIPDMHYRVIGLDGSDSDVVTITPDARNSDVAVMKANRAGTAIVLVTYDAMTHMAGMSSTASKKFSAIWPEQTGVFVVTVGGSGADIQTNMTLDRMDAVVTDAQRALDAEHDVLFYVGTAGASYSFKPESGCTVTVARSTVGDTMTFSGFTAQGVEVEADGTVTVTGLTTGRHIMRVEKDGAAVYQVVSAREVTYQLVDSQGSPLTDEAKAALKAGDAVYIQFSGLINPKEKLATAYNFNFALYYQGEDGTYFKSNPGGNFGVYDFSGNPERQLIQITIPKYWAGGSYTLAGALKQGGFAGVPSHRSIRYAVGNDPQFSAPASSGVLSRLPELTLDLTPAAFLTGQLTFNGGSIARPQLDITLTDEAGNVLMVREDGTFSAYAETYHYIVRGAGVAYATGSVTLTEDGENRFDIALTVTDDSAWDGSAQTEPAQDENGVYQIATGAQLAWFVDRSKSAAVSGVLTADIDLAGYPWLDVQASGKTELDGAGREIRGLNAQKGLFSQLGAEAKVHDLTLRGASAAGGSVTGYANSGAVVENCISYVTVSGTGTKVGGIAGYANQNVVVRNCANFGDVTGSSDVGGIIGGFVGDGVKVTGCYNTGAVTATGGSAGGVFGSSGCGVTVEHCYNTGAVSGQISGGIGGQVKGSAHWSTGAVLAPVTVYDCYNTGSAAMGAFGSTDASSADISRCYYLDILPADEAAEALSEADMLCADLDGEAFGLTCGGYPALWWQTDVTFHHAADEGAVTAPTCAEKGYSTYICAKCDTAFRADYTAALGHDWCGHSTPEECAASDDCVYTAPTCTGEGTIVRTCRRDGCIATKTDLIPATGHTRGEDVTVYPAWVTSTCPVCGELNLEWNDPRLAFTTMPEAHASGITMTDGTYPWIYNEETGRFESTIQDINSAASQTSLTFTIADSGRLAFSYGVSSERNYDKATITLTSESAEIVIANGISGTETGSFDQRLSAGTYTLSLTYTKDSGSRSNDDLAYVSGLVLQAFGEEDMDDLATAEAVMAKISAIGTVTLDSESAIRAARTAYDLLSAKQKDLVSNYAVLVAAEAELARLKREQQGPDQGDTITVTFRLIGASLSEEDVDVGAGKGTSVYQTWLATRTCTLPKGSTVGDLFRMVLEEAGLRQVGAEDGYVAAIWAPEALGGYRLGEMDNGPRSGWMYTLNGSHPGLGLNAQVLTDKDAVVWHYVNDYAYEVEDWFSDETYPALGDESTWVDWDAVPDVEPSSGGSAGGETVKPGQKNPFTDVAETDFFYEAALWADEQGITKGYGSADTFAPHADCTRGEIVTFLWRAFGSPAPTLAENPFTDVKEGDYFYEAALWAYEKGITRGYGSADTFAAAETCTRAETVTFLCRAVGTAGSAEDAHFSDVAAGAFYEAAVAWAAGNGVTTGIGGGKFGPELTCSRGQIVTFLYRLLAGK